MKFISRGARWAALATSAVLVLAGCGAGSERGESSPTDRVGVSDDKIVVGGHYPLTGPVSPGYQDIPAGAQAYFDYVNANGGVNGRQIEYIVRDDAYNPSNTSQVVRELVLEDEVFAMLGGFGTPTHGAVVDYLAENDIPDLFPVTGTSLWSDPSAYPSTKMWQPSFEMEMKVFAEWILENRPDAKVGVLAQDSDIGVVVEQVAGDLLGDQVVATQLHQATTGDLAPQVSALKAAGADLVVIFSTPNATAAALMASLRLNFDPQWVVNRSGSNPDAIAPLLSRFSDGTADATAIMDGLVTSAHMPEPADLENGWSQLWQTVWDEHGDGKPLDSYRVTGMSIAYTFVQAAFLAGEDLTRQGIEEAIVELGEPGVVNPALSPFGFSGDSNLGLLGVRVVQVEGGEISKVLTPTLVTGPGDAPVEELTSGEDEDKPPASGIPE